MPKFPRAVDRALPLSPRVLLILWSLSEGPQHPYRLLKTTEALGRNRVSIGPASLYESIHALCGKGLIEETAPPTDESDADARRRYFKLTRFGRDVLEAEADRLSALAADLRRARIAPAQRRS